MISGKVEEVSHTQIKVPKVNGGRYPLGSSEKNVHQQFQVIRIVGPEDAKDVKLSARWGNTRIGIQLLGVFPTEEEAKEYVNNIYVKCENWSDYYVVSMWEWLEIPPEEEISETHRPEQPLLDSYMKGAQQRKIEEAQIMQLRREMAKEGVDGVNDIMLEDQKLYTLETREKQLQEIVKHPEDYPENMRDVAIKKLKQVQSELKNMRSREKIKDLVEKEKKKLNEKK